ncbi:glycosyltransferase [Candidatus Pelagibacter sp.]|nr:glycosyltransferase [Candidatus Pelagibacter sp.]
MRILYIPVTKKIKEKNFKNYLKCFFYDIYIVLKNFSFNKKISNSTSGYIDSAIHSNSYTLELPYNFCIIFSKILNLIFDGIFVNWKFTNYRRDINDLELKLINLSKKFKIKKVIVDGTDKSIHIIKDEILEGFDYVIKREKNKLISNKKYLTTMLPCKLVDYKISKKHEDINWSKVGKFKPNDKFKYDIYFSGRLNSKFRNELIEFIKKQNLNFYGGVENFILPHTEYLETIYSSSINLALEGKGEFTFRHLEILASCSFMICQSSVNQLELPLPLLEGKHFVTFENKDDLLEKIKFYLRNKELRKEIALNGRKVLEEYYSPKRHGKFLINKIFS